MKLECPHCHYTLEVDEWNKEVENSMKVGRADELIPTNLEPETWIDYRMEHSGIVDCPQCKEVCVFDDMEAY